MLATPWGFRDILPDEASLREGIAETVRATLSARGYRPVETPLVEDKGSLEEAGRAAETSFKLFDDDGRLLVVRPDNTLSIARLVSLRLTARDLPLRLRYEAPVVRDQSRYAGGSRQFTQLGYELIGVGGAEGDLEVIRLAIESTRALGLPAWRLLCGSVRPLLMLLSGCADPSLSADALALVHANDYVGLDDRVARGVADGALTPAQAEALSELPRLYGGIEVLDRVDALARAAGAASCATAELRDLMARIAADPGLAPEAGRIEFDFSIMNSFDYYTGLVFKIYAGNLSDPVGSGGRYDAVFDGAMGSMPPLTELGPGATTGTAPEPLGHVPAAGFAFSLERLEGAREALDGRAVGAVEGGVARAAAGPLRIAVPKGSLNAGTISALEAAGLDVSSLRDPGRKLIVAARDTRADAPDYLGEVEFIIVRATDAPAFVACGGADCGFCGRDSLIEAHLDLLELVDMHYGACRFIEAEPAGREGQAERAYARRGSIRVATKYPRIAGMWYESRGITADIIALHGNIELGPIVGLSDRIVDITATGTTLRENDLVITGELLTCTARFFANPGRARLDARVRALGNRLAEVAKTIEER